MSRSRHSTHRLAVTVMLSMSVAVPVSPVAAVIDSDLSDRAEPVSGRAPGPALTPLAVETTGAGADTSLQPGLAPILLPEADDPDELYELVDLAVGDLDAGHDSLADDRLARALAMAPGHRGITKWAVTARLRLRQAERALAALAALGESSYDPECWRLSAQAHLLLGDSDAAFAALQRSVAVALGPRSVPQGFSRHTGLRIPDLAGVADDVLLPELAVAFMALQERRFEDALAQVAAVMPPDGVDSIWRAVTAMAELGLGRPQAARTQLQAAIIDDPGFGFAWATLAEIALSEGDVAEAERCFGASLAVEPADLRALMGMTRLARLAQDPVAEQRWLAAAYRYHPGESGVVLGLAEVLLKSGQVHEAGQVLAGLSPAQAASPDALRLLGLYGLQAGNFGAAVGYLSQLVSLRPESKEAWFQLARAQAARGDIGSARHSFEIAIGLDSEHSLPLLRLALAALELREGRFEDALALAEAVRQVHPNDARAYDLRAAAYAGQGDWPGRMAAMEAGYALQPTRERLQGLVGVLDAQGDGARSDRLITDWLAQHPDDRRLWLMLAQRLEAQGNSSHAVDAYEQALVDPYLASDPTVLIAAAALYLERRDPRALELADRAYRLAPTRPDVVGLFGWVSIAQGDRDEGMSLLTQAVRMTPHDPMLVAYLDAAMAQEGPDDNASPATATPIEGR